MVQATDVPNELKLAKLLWGLPGKQAMTLLRELIEEHDLSIARGDLLLLSGNCYVTHSGLLRMAYGKRCHGIWTYPVKDLCDRSSSSFVFRAIVYKSAKCRGFVGYGDADPSNVSPLVRGAEVRVAETRAVNRALRKAYGIGICSFEELGIRDSTRELLSDAQKRPSQSANGNGWATGPRVRDRLCQLIRKHELDPDLVKAYATDFCGVKNLREAKREQVENFVQSLADWVDKDRNALLCQLNSYIRVKENTDRKDGAA